MMEFVIIFLLILLNGIFSMSEIALVSSRKFKLEGAAKKGNKGALKALEMANNPNTFLATVQIGITLIGILTGIFSGDQMTLDIQTAVAKITILQPYAHGVAVAIVVIIITFFSIIFGELIPKRIGLTYPETIAALVAKPMNVISIITKPFIWLLGKTSDFFFFIFGIKEKKEGSVSEDEIKSIIQDSTDSGEIQEIEQNIVERVFALGDRKVSELMTHRSNLVWLDIADDLQTVKQKMSEEVHSVYPVANGPLDNFEGVVSVKELFPKNLPDADFSLQGYLKQPLFVPANTAAYKVLELFKNNKLHYAMIVDEYGYIQGMIAMDDIIDALVGDVSEYNQTEYSITKRDESSWLADGQYPYFEMLGFFGLADEDEKENNFSTIGGLVIHLLHHIPVTGEKVKWKGYEIEIVDMDERRIDKVLITKSKRR